MASLIGTIPLVNTLRDAVFLSATVSELDQLTPRLRRIRLHGPRLRGLKWTPGQHARLQVAGLVELALRMHAHDALRTYTIFYADPEAGTLDIAMLNHDGEPNAATPAGHWAATAVVEDRVSLTRPRGNVVIRPDASYHVFAGEETASVAFAAMLRSLAPDAQVHGVIEGACDTDHLRMARSLTHVERGDAPAANSIVLARALRALPLPDHPGLAYLAARPAPSKP